MQKEHRQKHVSARVSKERGPEVMSSVVVDPLFPFVALLDFVRACVQKNSENPCERPANHLELSREAEIERHEVERRVREFRERLRRVRRTTSYRRAGVVTTDQPLIRQYAPRVYLNKAFVKKSGQEDEGE